MVRQIKGDRLKFVPDLPSMDHLLCCLPMLLPAMYGYKTQSSLVEALHLALY